MNCERLHENINHTNIYNRIKQQTSLFLCFFYYQNELMNQSKEIPKKCKFWIVFYHNINDFRINSFYLVSNLKILLKNRSIMYRFESKHTIVILL